MRLSRKSLILIGGAVFVLGSIGSVELTSQSWFCGTCHIMDPYHKSWGESTHRGVKCVECHIPPGAGNFISAKLNGLGQVVDDVLARTSTKPSASVEDFACQRSGCHGPAAGGDLDPTAERVYRFKHEKHLGVEYKGIDIHCTTCHSHVKGDKHFQVNTNVCVTCHLIAESPEPRSLTSSTSLAVNAILFNVRRSVDPVGAEAQSEPPPTPTPTTPPARAALGDAAQETAELVAPFGCGNCHEPPDRPIKHLGMVIQHRDYLQYGTSCDSCHRAATAQPAPVKDAQCLSCHSFGIERVKNTEDVHRVHSEGKHKVECFSCHGMTQHGVIADAQSLRQLDCTNCHSGQHSVQLTTFASAGDSGTAEAAAMVSPMFLSHVDCNACHIESRPLDPAEPGRGTFLAAVPQACDACHQAGTGEKMVTMWQSDTHRLFDESMALLLKDSSGEAASPDVRRLEEEARRLLDLVKVDGSWGVHNPRYTAHLLELARNNLIEARRLSSGSPSEKPQP